MPSATRFYNSCAPAYLTPIERAALPVAPVMPVTTTSVGNKQTIKRSKKYTRNNAIRNKLRSSSVKVPPLSTKGKSSPQQVAGVQRMTFFDNKRPGVNL